MSNLWALKALGSVTFQILERVYAVLLILLILFLGLAGRGGDIFQINHYSRIEILLFYPTLALSAFLLFKEHRKLLLAIALLWGLLLLDSFVNFFGVFPWSPQAHDHLLSEHVSARWSMFTAMKELRHLLGFTTIFLPFFLLYRERYKTWVFGTFTACIVLNLGVAGIQKFINLDFLSAGSGSALSARRVPGLLEDSGAFACFLTMIVCGLLSSLSFIKMKVSQRLLAMFFTLSLFVLGFLGSGRIFILSTLLCVSLLAVLNVLKMIRYRSFKLGFVTFLTCLLAWFAFDYLSSHHGTYATMSMKSWNLKTLLSIEAWEKNIDFQRTKHILAMWETTKDHFPFGKGLGSFHSFCEAISKKFAWSNVFLDWPSSFYMQMLSELGFAGLCLLFCIACLFINGLLIRKKDAFHYFMLGAFFALLESWLVGIHYIFPSIALCVGFIFAYFYTKLSPSFKSLNAWSWKIACFFLLISLFK